MTGGQCNRCAGEVPCETCGDTVYVHDDEFGCQCCGMGSDEQNPVCEECSSRYKCGLCNAALCDECGKETWECCGLKICSKKDSCLADDHETEKLPCGHAGCSYRDEFCLTCSKLNEKRQEQDALEDDKPLIEKALATAKSKLVKGHLQACLDEISSSTEKRKLEE